MEFTFTFIKLFSYGAVLASPLLLFFMALIIIIGQVVGWKESWAKFDSLYWSFITASTVGYGDIRPLQKLSKLLAVLIAYVGLIFTGLVVALALNAATAAFKENNDISKIQEKAEQIKMPWKKKFDNTGNSK